MNENIKYYSGLKSVIKLQRLQHCTVLGTVPYFKLKYIIDTDKSVFGA